MTADSPVRILLVDDHAIVREGYRSLLKKQPGIEVAAEAADGEQAYRCYKQYTPDITIMDLSLPGQSGLETIARIKHRDRYAKIIVFSMHQNPRFAIQALRSGALAYVTKSSAAEELLKAIQRDRLGQPTLSPDIAEILALEKMGYEAGLLKSLSAREFEIFKLLAEALSKDEIASLLNVSVKTVANSHYVIKRKLGVSSDIELTHLAIKLNIIDVMAIAGPSSL